jgi:hypothetical protein
MMVIHFAYLFIVSNCLSVILNMDFVVRACMSKIMGMVDYDGNGMLVRRLGGSLGYYKLTFGFLKLGC